MYTAIGLFIKTYVQRRSRQRCGFLNLPNEFGPEYRCTCMVNNQNKGYHSYFVSTLEKAGKQNSMEIGETMAAPVSGKILETTEVTKLCLFLSPQQLFKMET